MQDFLHQLQHLLQSIQDAILPSLYWARARIGIQTVTLAVISAGGMLILLLGVFSTKRVNLHGEAAHLEGVREPGPLDRLQTRLYQSGIRIKVHEFLTVGLMVGAALGGIFILLGFVSIGIAFGLSGPFVYYQFLMNRRIKEMREFREDLPIAILDTRDHLVMRANDLRGAMLEMAERGPKSLRVDFDYAFRMMASGADSEPLALREVSRKREEPFFRQFFDALANHHKGGDTAEVLTRVAHGQKTHNRLQAKTRAKQSGLRLVGMLYLIAPPLFAVFMALSGGAESVAFYASLEGQLVQLLAVLAGVLSYWLSSKIAMRGLYMDEVTRVRLDTEQMSAFVTSDEFGGTLGSEPSLAGADIGGTQMNGQPVAAMAAPSAATISSNGNGTGAHPGVPVKVLDDAFDLEPEGDDDQDDSEADEPIDDLLAFQDLDMDALFRVADSDGSASTAETSNLSPGATHPLNSAALPKSSAEGLASDDLASDDLSDDEEDDLLDDKEEELDTDEVSTDQTQVSGTKADVAQKVNDAPAELSQWARPASTAAPAVISPSLASGDPTPPGQVDQPSVELPQLLSDTPPIANRLTYGRRKRGDQDERRS